VGAEENREQPGLFAAGRRLLQLTAQTLHVRIGIFSIELREEGLRMIRIFALMAAFIFLAAVTLLLGSFTVIFAVWDDPQARLTALGVLCGIYFAGTAVAGAIIYRALKAERLPFSDTLREFEKDRQWAQNPSEKK
jgi:uncharacterized membrane protein YqjE